MCAKNATETVSCHYLYVVFTAAKEEGGCINGASSASDSTETDVGLMEVGAKARRQKSRVGVLWCKCFCR